MDKEQLIEAALAAYREGTQSRWKVCEISEELIGKYQNGAAQELADKCGVTVSQISNYARAGLAWKSLRYAAGVDADKLILCRERLPITHWSTFADMWVKLEFDPVEAFGSMAEVAAEDKIITVGAFRNLLMGLYGGEVKDDWQVHLDKIAGQLKRLKQDYGVPEGIRIAADECVRLLTEKNSANSVTTVVIPDVKPESLNTIWSGQHWGDRATLANKWHALVRAYMDVDAPTPYVPLCIEITAYVAHHPQDPDNILVKPIIDGMIGWLIPRDTPDVIDSIRLASRIDKLRPRVEVKLISLPGSKEWIK